jgi:protein kinase-like protein
MSSSSSTDAEIARIVGPGVELEGFRLEREIGRGETATVYEATQLRLERRVALKLIPPDPELAERVRRLQWPQHPHVVSMYSAGVCEHGQFVAMQLVHGSTLADLHEAGSLEPAHAQEILSDVATALDAAHKAGIAHGGLSATNVLVDRDGRAFVSDFGLGRGEATPESDRIALAELVKDCLGSLRPRRVRRPWRRAAALGAGSLLGVVALVVILAGSDGKPAGPPPVLPGARALGSTLSSTRVSSVDCNGRPPNGASQACTVAQTRLSGRPLVAPGSGVIRRWTVRGARGQLAFQVLRPRGDRFDSIARTRFERVPDERVHAIPADLPIRAGDLVGLEVAPGAAVGIRRDAREATTARWFTPLTSLRPMERGPGSGFDHELQLRVEYMPGAKWRPPGLLTGRVAERARRGRELAADDVQMADGEVRRVAAVRLRDHVAFDLFAGKRRMARLVVAGADPRGTLLGLAAYPKRPGIVRIEWRNRARRTITHDYAVGAKSIVPRS